ncbi:MAG: three-Cys-motif partner protein TcmP [Chloroflexi bacterium]|nr:three-Cys-motif partner protein TcmP [Chloroflexota bacterium]
MKLVFDEIGYWTEVKLDIIKQYATEYSKILSNQTNPQFHHVYIDAFAGPGKHFSKDKKHFVPGSPQIALTVSPPFRDYYFIDIDRAKLGELKKFASVHGNVHIFEGDCNEKLMTDVFPNVKYEDYRRGLCLLDPYGLHLNWDVIKTAGEMKSIDMFLNFPVADMNRNVLWRNPENVDPAEVNRMNTYWGDETWREVAYNTQRNLFGMPVKEDNETIADAFRKRLVEVANFQYVPNPLPMRNSKNAIIYYLYFASQKPVASNIVEYIFKHYSDFRG